MTEYIFSDMAAAKELLGKHEVSLANLYSVINRLARYNYFVLKLNKTENYRNINVFLKQFCADYSEVSEYKVIDRCINRAKKYNWIDIDRIVITQEELKKISILGDDKKEKIAFVLLADAKYNKACGKYDFDASFLSINKIFTLARVTIPRADRNLFLNFLYDKELVVSNTNPSFKGKILTYVSETDDDIAMELREIDYKELAFTYMNWKHGGYKRCKKCGGLFKSRKNMQYCKRCVPKYIPMETKIITCIDCGKEVPVDARNTKSCRCLECQHEEDKRIKREYWNKIYSN